MVNKISNEVIAIYAASSSYKERFIAEYIQLKQRYEKLKVFNTKIEAARGTEHFHDCAKAVMPKHDCPDYLLKEQQRVMGEYLHILEVRAVIEGIDLEDAIKTLYKESLRRESKCCASTAEDTREIGPGIEAKGCCKSEKTPPCEEGIYENAECRVQSAESPSLPENVIDLNDTIKIFEKCKYGENPCDGCMICDNGCVKKLYESVLYHLKSYA